MERSGCGASPRAQAPPCCRPQRSTAQHSSALHSQQRIKVDERALLVCLGHHARRALPREPGIELHARKRRRRIYGAARRGFRLAASFAILVPMPSRSLGPLPACVWKRQPFSFKALAAHSCCRAPCSTLGVEEQGQARQLTVNDVRMKALRRSSEACWLTQVRHGCVNDCGGACHATRRPTLPAGSRMRRSLFLR